MFALYAIWQQQRECDRRLQSYSLHLYDTNVSDEGHEEDHVTVIMKVVSAAPGGDADPPERRERCRCRCGCGCRLEHDRALLYRCRHLTDCLPLPYHYGHFLSVPMQFMANFSMTVLDPGCCCGATMSFYSHLSLLKVDPQHCIFAFWLQLTACITPSL